jgi:chromosome partitioning related protein ParA
LNGAGDYEIVATPAPVLGEKSAMPTVISFVSTKGGVGKTTLAANLAGILADYGMRVLAIDGDIQPSLSKYYPLHEQASCGLNAVITRGGCVHADSISRTTIANLDLIYSDAPDGSLQNWLRDREDRLMIMRRAMAGPLVQPYNVVVIDTQGAVGELQKTAAMAAD